MPAVERGRRFDMHISIRSAWAFPHQAGLRPSVSAVRPGETGSRTFRVLDALEKLLLIGFLNYLAYHLVPHLYEKPTNAAYLISEAIVVGLVAMRRTSRQITSRPVDWLAAFGGTFLPLLVVPSAGSGLGPGGLLMLAGLSVSIGAQFS